MKRLEARADILRLLGREARPLHGEPHDYDSLLEQVGDAQFVLLGEGSHGTHEFYRERVRITRRLIEEKGFSAVAIEGDWPDAYRVNRYVRGLGDDGDAEEALRGFERFPTWMWRNADVLDFVGWLRSFNDDRASGAPKVGFYGLDVYSLFASADAVIKYLERHDPAAAQRAREHYACFDYFGPDEQAYARAVQQHGVASCEEDVITVLTDMRRRVAAQYRRANADSEDAFCAAQNANVVASAEQYYRTMFDPQVSSWSVRDRHMAHTLDDLSRHLGAAGQPAKVVVWAHNSHVGDARATDMLDRREVNIGQLCRESYGTNCVLVGFTTYAGTVTAARDWHAPAERRAVRPARPESIEGLLHDVGQPVFLLSLRSGESRRVLVGSFLERAIGVVYRPQTELASHYMQARPARQFDALIHIDHTRAVEPLERSVAWERGEVPETFPTGV